MRTPPTSLTRQGLSALAHQVLAGRASIGISRIGERSARALHVSELAQMGGAIPARVMEFVAGRVAARVALGSDTAIPMDEDRAPIWPRDVAGTITHAAGWAVAAVAPAPLMLGLDLETDQDLPRDIWDVVLSKTEQAWCLVQPEPGRAATLIFSIKECAYKAQYAQSRQVFGFERFEVSVGAGDFSARFTADTGPFAAGFVVNGLYRRSEGIILTGVAQ